MGWFKLSSVNLGWLGNAERSLIEWLYHRYLERLMRRIGGIQMCPWCHTCAQAHDGWHFDSKSDPSVDALHCGNCGGVSNWRFEMGMIPVEPHRAKPPKEPDPMTLTEQQIADGRLSNMVANDRNRPRCPRQTGGGQWLR